MSTYGMILHNLNHTSTSENILSNRNHILTYEAVLDNMYNMAASVARLPQINHVSTINHCAL